MNEVYLTIGKHKWRARGKFKWLMYFPFTVVLIAWTTIRRLIDIIGFLICLVVFLPMWPTAEKIVDN